ncbi:MAG: VacJ family lipoprotein [Proteobacteria bacterium]|nr:VacJ family lipoprotein [Pseudomonadota bacterium]
MVVLAFGLTAPVTSFAAGLAEGDPAHVNLAQASEEEAVNDPLESMNRAIFDFNEVLQDVLLRPVAKFYNATVNVTVRQGISNFLNNLSSPVIFANDLLQGEFERALTTFGRAFINSTLGIVGLADVATELGIERHDEDFGQTLAVYGMGEGFYLVLPIFGPSSPRDAIGKLVIDSYLDPLGLWLDNTDRDNIQYTLTGAEGLDEYAGIVDELNQVKKTSVDYYAAVRSLYRQKRKAEINNGSILELPPIPDLSYDITPEDFDQPLAGVSPPAFQ